MKIAVTCPCGVKFNTTQVRVDGGRGKFCSRTCMYKYRSPRPRGLTYKITQVNRAWLTPGHTRTPKGPNNPQWKGDEVGYRQLHDWVRQQRSYPGNCEWCHRPCKPEWANISHQYLRDITDWVALCRSCHRKHDSGSGYGAAIAKYGRDAVREGR